MDQKAGKNSKQLQIKELHIHNGMQPEEIRSLCLDLIQHEIATYKLRASVEANRRFNELMEKYLNLLTQLEEVKRQRLQEPAIQFAVFETFTEYIRSGEEFLGDELVDLLIERMSVQEHTSKQVLIDEARRVLPKLTKKQVDVLAVFAFVRFILTRPRLQFVETLNKIGELGESIGMVKAIDMAILVQSGCATDSVLKGTDYAIAPIFQSSYDSFFRKPVMKPQMLSLLQNYTKEEQKLLFQYVGYLKDEDEWYYKYSTLDYLRHYRGWVNNPEKSKILKSFDGIAQKMSIEEVEDYLKDINKNWEQILTLFKKDYMKSLTISPVGNYIGWRQFSKQTGEKLQFELFYPNK